MSVASRCFGHAWTSYWQFMRRFHRFEVRGLERIVGIGGPAMIVGYHGKPGARDLIMLQMLLMMEYGQLTRAVAHDMAFNIPLMRDAAEGMLIVSRNPKSLEEAVARGEKLVITPGGIEEAWGSYRDRYRVKWRRSGYLKLAIRHKLPVIPVAGIGVDDAFYGLYNGYDVWKPVWDKFNLPPAAGWWIGVGPLGFWPHTPPFPSKIVQYVGTPIDLEAEGLTDPDDRQALQAFNERLADQVQDMLDRGRAEAKGRTSGPEFEELRWV